jgi:hypothetical protein
MTKFNIGDKVKVVDNGKSYTTYQTWADVYGLKNYKSKEFYCPNNGTVATIVAKAKHLGGNEMLVGIRIENGDEYIIEDKGLELISPSLKSMLTNGRRVKLRNGEMYTVIDRFLVKPLYSPVTEELVGMAIDNVLSENLTHKYGSEYDVVSIYERYNNNVNLYFCHNLMTDLIWQRKEKTAKQLQLEALQKQAQAVADAIKKLQDEE